MTWKSSMSKSLSISMPQMINLVLILMLIRVLILMLRVMMTLWVPISMIKIMILRVIVKASCFIVMPGTVLVRLDHIFMTMVMPALVFICVVVWVICEFNIMSMKFTLLIILSKFMLSYMGNWMGAKFWSIDIFWSVVEIWHMVLLPMSCHMWCLWSLKMSIGWHMPIFVL